MADKPIHFWTRPDSETGRRISAAAEELEIDLASWLAQVQALIVEDDEACALQTIEGLRTVLGYQIDFMTGNEEEPHAKH